MIDKNCEFNYNFQEIYFQKIFKMKGAEIKIVYTVYKIIFRIKITLIKLIVYKNKSKAKTKKWNKIKFTI